MDDYLLKIKNDGVCVIPNVVSKNEASRMRMLLQKFINEDLAKWAGKDYSDRWMVHNLMIKDKSFADLLENPILHKYFSLLLGDTCILYAYTSSSMPAGGANYSHRIHVDSPRFIPNYWTNVGMMLALDDFREDNGATYFLPGSHLLPDVPDEKFFLKNAIRVYPKTGDAVIFSARTWHMGGENKSPEPRHAVTMNICRSYMRQRFDYPRLVPEDVEKNLGEIGKRFLGFDVRVPVSLDEYYLPVDQRLYKANQG